MKLHLVKRAAFAAIAFAATAWMSASNAAVIVKDNSTVVNIPGLSTFVTTGAQMTGMSVSATFSNGAVETLAWAATGADSGGVSGAGWSLNQSGNTFGGLWTFGISNTNLGQLTILKLDGGTGLTVFDTAFDPFPGTDGSANGLDFAISNATLNAAATATYSNAVAVIPNALVGDIYHVLTVTFGNEGPRTSFQFIQDTDNDIRITQVPEPGTLALLALGIAGGLAASRRRKQQSASA